MQVENSRMIYRGSNELARVYRGDHVIVWEPEDRDYSSEYLTFKNVGTSSGLFVFKPPYGEEQRFGIEISKNSGPWVYYSGATVSDRTVNRGEIIRVKGNHVTYTNIYSYSLDNNSSMFISGGTAYHVFGNIMSLIYGDNFSGQTRLRSENDRCFAHLLGGYNCTDAKNLVLPATILSEGCYTSLLAYTNIKTAPTLPATTLAVDCYNGMFRHCTSLVNAPELPATRMKDDCYHLMFEECTSLESAPDLPATILAVDCYHGMFEECTSLVNPPVISASTLANYCCFSMFRDCTSLVSPPDLPATTLAKQCYAGMFQGCTSLVSTPAVLPATALSIECYWSMFEGCTSLVSTPALLPATTTMSSCYQSMFKGCTSLVNAPALPATVLRDSCYRSMFEGCTSLANAPELPVETLKELCYAYMFHNCGNLNYIKCLAIDITASNSTTGWVSGVSQTGTFVKSPYMSNWTTGDDGIPNGWTIIDAT